MGNSLCFRQSISMTDQAVLDLKSLKKKLNDLSRDLEGKISRGRTVAKQLKSQNKVSRAKLVSRQVVLQEKMLSRCQQQEFQVESMLLQLSEQETMIHVVNTLKDGNAAMKELQKIVTVAEIDVLTEETREAREKQQQIETCLAQVYGKSDFIISDSDLELDTVGHGTDRELSGEYPKVPMSGVSEGAIKKERQSVLVAV